VKPTPIWQNYLDSVFQRKLTYTEYLEYTYYPDYPRVLQSLEKIGAKKHNWYIEFDTDEDKLEFQLTYG